MVVKLLRLFGYIIIIIIIVFIKILRYIRLSIQIPLTGFQKWLWEVGWGRIPPPPTSQLTTRPSQWTIYYSILSLGWRYILTAKYLWLLYFFCLIQLRLWFFVGSLNSYLVYYTHDDKDKSKSLVVACKTAPTKKRHLYHVFLFDLLKCDKPLIWFLVCVIFGSFEEGM